MKQSPVSVFLKEQSIKKIAKEHKISEKIVAQIVSHQFKTFKEALKTEDRVVELIGLGKFFFHEKRAVKLFKDYVKVLDALSRRLDEPGLTQAEIRNAKAKYNTVMTNFKELCTKFRNSKNVEIIENIRRLEK